MSQNQLTLTNVERVLSDHGLVVVDAWASWCGPCRAFAPIFEAAALRHPDAKFMKLNTEEEADLSQILGVRALPTLLVFREGVLVFQQAGMMPGQVLDTIIQRARAIDGNLLRKHRAAQVG